MHTVIPAVSSYVQLHNCIQKTLFPCSHRLPWLFQSFSSLFHNDFWVFRGGGVVWLSHLEHSLVSYYRHLDQPWASVFLIIYYMKKLSDEGCEMLWSMGIPVRHRSWFTSRPIQESNSMGSFPCPMTFLTTGPWPDNRVKHGFQFVQ